VALGHVATRTASPPVLPTLRCIRQDLASPLVVELANLVWDDRGSGLSGARGLFEVPGARTMFATRAYQLCGVHRTFVDADLPPANRA
jgi:hypothetical protein